jgi:hypothetical protein
MRIDLTEPHGLADELLACKLARVYTLTDADMADVLERVARLPANRYNAVLESAYRTAKIYLEKIKPDS